MFYFIIGSALLGIIFALFLVSRVLKAAGGSPKMEEIALAIRQGAQAYLKRQYITIALVACLVALALFYFLGAKTALGFLVGALASGLAGYIGMQVSVRANVKTAQAAKQGLASALKLAFQGGSVTGLLVASLGLLSVSGFYFLFKDLHSLVALGFGGSLISIFARLGGGIYTKAADIGADLVGKVEVGIPEDDPRNPAVIADNVGDNVGDCAGMAADLFETYAVTAIAAMILGHLTFPESPWPILLPLLLGAIAILASIAGTFFVRLGQSQNIMAALYKGLISTALLSGLGFYFLIRYMLSEIKSDAHILTFFGPACLGLLVTFGLMLVTDYFTAKKYKPVQAIAQASLTGPATNIITGLAMGMLATGLPIILIVAGILISFWLAGLYGIALAAMAMLSLTGLIVALDSYGPITDNASGIAEMAGLSKEIRQVTDPLDAVGNTTKAVTKAYAIGSAGLAALVLFAAYVQELEGLALKSIVFRLDEPLILVGLLLGGLLPYLFGALALQAVGKSGAQVVAEVRRQFKEIKGILEGIAKPDYARCVDMVTRSALRQMILPALLPVLAPLLVGFILGPQALGGLLIGSIITGLFMAISMTSGGAAWDNAKKYIEEGNLGGKGSFAHQAAVIGDTVGDGYKDTAGPAINPMIKVLNIVALLIVSFLV